MVDYTTRRFSDYVQCVEEDTRPDNHASAIIDRRIANGAVWCYSRTRRNVLGITHNLSGTVSLDNPNQWHEWINVPIDGRVTRPGKFKFWIFRELDNEVYDIDCMVQVGNDAGVTNMHLSAQRWSYVEVDLTDKPTGSDRLRVSFKAGAYNQLIIESACAYQPEGDPAGTTIPDWVDIGDADSVIADPDGALSTFQYSLIRDCLTDVRWCKAPRANVFCHSYAPNYKAAGVYDADYRGLGTYRVVKRRGVSEIKMHLLAKKVGGTGDWTLRVDINGSAQTTTINTTSLSRYTLTWSLAGADITDELEPEIKIDGQEQVLGSGPDMYLLGWSLVETSGSSVTHQVPDQDLMGTNSPIEADHSDDIRTALVHLWEYGGRQIIGSDWRNQPDGTETQQMKATSHDKTEDAGQCVAARAITFSSTGARRIRVRWGFVTSSGSTYQKAFLVQLSDSTTLTTWTDADPRFDGYQAFSGEVVADWDHPSGREDACYLEIDDSQWEEHYDGSNEPPQVWVTCGTANAAEWIEPSYCMIDEDDLMQVEFPDY